MSASDHVPTRSEAARPNIVFIICDDLNDAVCGMGGHPQAKTPHIDRLMRRGVRFTNAACNVPICGPSRASLLSGIGPWSSGYYGYNFCNDAWWNNALLNGSLTFMEHFARHGYKIYGTGKVFHNYHEKNEVWKDGMGHIVDWGPWSWDGQRPGNGWQSCAGHHTLPRDWGAEMMFASLDDLPDIPPDPATGAPGYRGWRHDNGRPFRYVSPEDRDLMNDELNAQFAARVISQQHEAPFMLCVGIGRPHAPLIAPQKFFDMFPLESIELAPILEGDLADCGQAFQRGRVSTSRWGFEKYRKVLEAGGEHMLRRWTQAYLACVAFADEQIGKILSALEASPYADNTYVVLTSDNGYHMGEKEYLFKNSCWEESARVPLVFAGPRVKRGAECDTPVSLVDLFPTFNDLCGLPMDVNMQGTGKALDGHVLTPLLEHPERGEWDGPPGAITAVASDTPLKSGTPGAVCDQHWSVRTKKFRYILYNSGEEELYDHERDPQEWTNLANDAAYDAIKAEHRKILREVTGHPKI